MFYPHDDAPCLVSKCLVKIVRFIPNVGSPINSAILIRCFYLGLKTPSGNALACAGVHECTLKHALVIYSRDGPTRFLDVKNRQVSLSNGRLWEVIGQRLTVKLCLSN